MSPTVSTVAWIYLAANSARGLFYLPQLRVVLKCNDGARNVSLLSWTFFAASHASALAYAMVCVHDSSLVLMSGINVLGSALIAGSIAWKRLSASADGLRRLPTLVGARRAL
jgi:hypothetical protein